MLKSTNIQFAVTPEEKEEIKKLANKEHLDMSSYIRYKCLKIKKEEN